MKGIQSGFTLAAIVRNLTKREDSMHIRKIVSAVAAAMLSCQPLSQQAFAWHDRTHLSIAEAAGFDLWYSAAAPDVAKSKAQFEPIESPNHYFNNNDGRRVTASMVEEQVPRYNCAGDMQGHLYGAIIGSVQAYRDATASGKYALYPLVFTAHYVGDLSQPLHNTRYDDFNRARHSASDGVIDVGVRDSIPVIRSRMEPIVIRNDRELAKEIARVAEAARRLGGRLRAENRNMTAGEAMVQVGRSASLFNAILRYVGRLPEER